MTFSIGAFFQWAIFSYGADFKATTFKGTADFSSATFSEQTVNLENLSHGTDFSYANFLVGAYFVRATFSRHVWFTKAEFGWADFTSAKFLRRLAFDSVIFHGGSKFDHSVMKDVTWFHNVRFETEPPVFFGATLHESTVWWDVTWPPKPKNKEDARFFVIAYERLKLEMDRLKKHDDELDFFALELQSRRVEQGPVRGLPIALYGVLSDYGRSYVWPLLWLFAGAAFGAVIFRHFGALTLGEASGLGFANTLNVFGFRKDFIDPWLIARLPPWLEAVAAIQTILGTILLFLFGLGIRNKFRMK